MTYSYKYNYACSSFLPGGVKVLHLMLHPPLVTLRSVWKANFTILVRLVMSSGREGPQLFFIKIVPSPSVIVRWS